METRRVASALLCFVTVGAVIFSSTPVSDVRGDTLFVGGAGSGNYSSLQVAINDASPGDLVYIYNGSYEERVFIDKPLSLHGEDEEGVLVSGSGTGTVVRITSDWVDVSQITVTGSGANGDFAGVRLDAVSNCQISNITVFGNWFGMKVNDSDAITIMHNSISDNDIGVRLLESTNLTLIGNSFANNGISIGGEIVQHWVSHNIDSTNSVNEKPLYYWKNTDGGAIHGGEVGQVILANCTRITIDGLNISQASVGIQLGFSRNNTLEGNTIRSNSVHGISLHHSTDNEIIRNTVSSSGYNGLSIYFESLRNLIGENEILSSNWNGVYLFDSAENTILNNTLSGNGNGVHVDRSSHTVIAYNNASLQNGDCILLRSSDNATIHGNTLRRSHSGVDLSSSIGNRVFHNYLIGNSEQTFDDSSGNQWDDGYPSGGNYYSDYGGFDNLMGPNQDQPGSDGIGDTPYLISGGNMQDRYPLLPTPSAPEDLSAETGNRIVRLAWSPPSSDGGLPIIAYRVLRGNSTSEKELLVETSITPRFSDVNVTNYQTYYYQVMAVNLVGRQGPRSNEVMAKPVNKPPACLIIYPMFGVTVSGLIAAMGTSNDTDGGVRQVEARIDDDVWHLAEGTESWSLRIDTTVLSNGDHTIYVRSYDGENYSTTQSTVFTVENVRDQQAVFEQAWIWIVLIAALLILLLLVTRRRRLQSGDEVETETYSSDNE